MPITPTTAAKIDDNVSYKPSLCINPENPATSNNADKNAIVLLFIFNLS